MPLPSPSMCPPCDFFSSLVNASLSLLFFLPLTPKSTAGSLLSPVLPPSPPTFPPPPGPAPLHLNDHLPSQLGLPLASRLLRWLSSSLHQFLRRLRLSPATPQCYLYCPQLSSSRRALPCSIFAFLLDPAARALHHLSSSSPEPPWLSSPKPSTAQIHLPAARHYVAGHTLALSFVLHRASLCSELSIGHQALALLPEHLFPAQIRLSLATPALAFTTRALSP